MCADDDYKVLIITGQIHVYGVHVFLAVLHLCYVTLFPLKGYQLTVVMRSTPGVTAHVRLKLITTNQWKPNPCQIT